MVPASFHTNQSLTLLTPSADGFLVVSVVSQPNSANVVATMLVPSYRLI